MSSLYAPSGRYTLISCVLLGLIPQFHANAETFNLDALVLKRIQDAGKTADAYQRAFGRALPKDATLTTQFIGTTSGSIEYLPNRSVSPRIEVIDMASVQNCNEFPTKDEVKLGKVREDSFSLSNTDTVETSVSVSIGVESPFGSARSDLKQSWSSSTTKAQTASTAVNWQRTHEVPIGAGKQVLTQLTLDTSNVSGSYRLPLLLKGDTKIKVLASATPYSWKGVSGKRLPADALAAGRESGLALQICAHVLKGQVLAFGKVWKGGCEIAPRPELTGMIFHVILSGYSVLTGDANTMQWMSAAEHRASGKPMYFAWPGSRYNICLAKHDDSEVPGNLNGSVCQYTTRDKYRETTDYKVLMPASIAAVGGFKLEDVLNEAQRTVDVSGKFSGTAGMNVKIRIGTPVTVDPKDCLDSAQANTAPSSAATTSAHRNTNPLDKLQKAIRIKKLPVDTNTPVIASGQ